MSNKIKKKLKSDIRFIPFNDKYDFKYIAQYLKNYNSTDDTLYLESNALNSVFFNKYYVQIKDYFNTVINRNKLSKNTFSELIISFANRDLYLINNRTQDSFNGKNEIDYDNITNSHVQSSIPELGLINAQAGLEASHDGLNTILNMNHQNVNESTISEFELNHLDNCVRILGFANIYTVIKAAYDIAIWEDYTLQFNRKKDEIKIKCIHEKNQILNRIGQNRLERNIFSSKMMLTTAFKNKTNFYALLYSESKKKRKAKRLKWVKIIDNEIIYKLADGFEKESIFREILSFAGLVNYYSFIKNENLPDFKKINLHDILLIFTEVQYIFSKAFEIDKIEKKDESSNIEIFTQYRMKIKKHDLISYLLNKTKYSKAQIIQIIEIFIHKDGIFNIWEQPLHEIDNYLFPIMLPLTSPNTLRMIDFWLEKGGFNLEKRGKLFENHLIEVLLKALNEKGYKVNIPKKNIYKNRYGQQEEIDLIVELKNVTIIAEVKCIKYPFGPRDYHNMYKRLSEGAEQINRKATFINSNKSDFEKHSFLSKPLIKLVITNYPFFSGYKIKDVPIVDASLIDNYFINGALSNGKLITEKKKLQLDISINSSTKYYSNEDELSNNLSDFMNNPIPISKKINDVYIEENQISLPSASPKIVMDYVKFKHTNII